RSQRSTKRSSSPAGPTPLKAATRASTKNTARACRKSGRRDRNDIVITFRGLFPPPSQGGAGGGRGNLPHDYATLVDPSLRFFSLLHPPRALCASFKNLPISSDTARESDLGEEGFVDSGGVRIHYVTKGAGPLVVLIHGCPDHWYGWRGQIPALA